MCSRGHRLVQQFQNVELGDDAGLVCRLTLGEAEVRRNGDDGAHPAS